MVRSTTPNSQKYSIKHLAFVLCLSTSVALAQGVRYDNRVVTVSSNVPSGASAPMLAIPNSKVTICADGNCGSLASVFSNQALSVPASNPMKTDGQGRFGFWSNGGTYFYQVQDPSGNILGIFPITLGGSGGSGNVISVNGQEGEVVLVAFGCRSGRGGRG